MHIMRKSMWWTLLTLYGTYHVAVGYALAIDTCSEIIMEEVGENWLLGNDVLITCNCTNIAVKDEVRELSLQVHAARSNNENAVDDRMVVVSESTTDRYAQFRVSNVQDWQTRFSCLAELAGGHYYYSIDVAYDSEHKIELQPFDPNITVGDKFTFTCDCSHSATSNQPTDFYLVLDDNTRIAPQVQHQCFAEFKITITTSGSTHMMCVAEFGNSNLTSGRSYAHYGDAPQPVSDMNVDFVNLETLQFRFSRNASRFFTTSDSVFFSVGTESSWISCGPKEDHRNSKEYRRNCQHPMTIQMAGGMNSTLSWKVTSENQLANHSTELQVVRQLTDIALLVMKPIRVESISAVSVDLSWQSPLKSLMAVTYHISYADSCTSHTSTSKLTTSNRTVLHTISGFKGHSTVQVNVTACVTDDDVICNKHTVETINVVTNTAAPLHTPTTSLSLYQTVSSNATHRNVTVYWTELTDQCALQGELISYQLAIVLDPTTKPRNMTVQTMTTSNKHIVTLSTHHTYHVYVAACTSHSCTVDYNSSYVVIPELQEASTSDLYAWGEVSSSSRAELTMMIKWNDVPDAEVYTVLVCNNNYAHCLLNAVSSDMNQYELTDMDTYQHYAVSYTPHNHASAGLVHVQCIYRQQLGVHIDEKSISHHSGKDKVDLTIDLHTCKDRAHVDKLRIDVCKVDGSHDCKPLPQHQYNKTLADDTRPITHTITGLEQDTAYNVTVGLHTAEEQSDDVVIEAMTVKDNSGISGLFYGLGAAFIVVIILISIGCICKCCRKSKPKISVPILTEEDSVVFTGNIPQQPSVYIDINPDDNEDGANDDDADDANDGDTGSNRGNTYVEAGVETDSIESDDTSNDTDKLLDTATGSSDATGVVQDDGTGVLTDNEQQHSPEHGRYVDDAKLVGLDNYTEGKIRHVSETQPKEERNMANMKTTTINELKRKHAQDAANAANLNASGTVAEPEVGGSGNMNHSRAEPPTTNVTESSMHRTRGDAVSPCEEHEPTQLVNIYPDNSGMKTINVNGIDKVMSKAENHVIEPDTDSDEERESIVSDDGVNSDYDFAGDPEC